MSSGQNIGSQKRTNLGLGIALIALVIALAVALWASFGVLSEQSKEQSAITIRETILDQAMQCFAVEGCYPPTLKYLEDHYGLSVDKEGFVITYEAFASNILPSVVVVPR